MTRVHVAKVGLAVLFLTLLSGCTTNISQPTNNVQLPAAEQKSGDTTKSGSVTESGGKFYLTVAGQPPLEIDSYSLDLSQYVGQTITATGQYSGNTLFIGSIQ